MLFGEIEVAAACERGCGHPGWITTYDEIERTKRELARKEKVDA
jgi:hypothetical protein